MTTARFELRDGVGFLVLTDGNHVVELNPKDAGDAFNLWQAHMRPIWDAHRAAKEQAERDAIEAEWRAFQAPITVAGEAWVIQKNPHDTAFLVAAWPANEDRQAARVSVGRSLGKSKPFAIQYRAYSWGGSTYMADWGTTRFANIESAIKGAIKRRALVLADSEASQRRNVRYQQKQTAV